MWPGNYLPTPAPENKTYVCVNIYTQVFLPRRNHQVLEATQASFNGGVSDVGENELETDTGMEVWMALGRPLAAGGRQEKRGRQEQHGMRELRGELRALTDEAIKGTPRRSRSRATYQRPGKCEKICRHQLLLQQTNHRISY
ncbi:uncharacterized protein isoform X4 [Macaca fascicularis]|uniref:uncharacterized protein isoform X4 n=1 Tax=Macaca fascicularis TaxID=9541 RepID=UPI003D1571E1